MKAQTLNIDRVTASFRADTDSGNQGAGETYLTPGGMLRLEVHRAGSVLVCLGGECWVTQVGDYTDYRLTPGETFPMARRGMILVQGLAGESKIRVDRGAARGRRRSHAKS